jgi:predicted metal-binding protein
MADPAATDFTDQDCERLINAVLDYNMDQIRHKMLVHGVDFEMACEMQMAVILAHARSE